jgi:hypothetical protein
VIDLACTVLLPSYVSASPVTWSEVPLCRETGRRCASPGDNATKVPFRKINPCGRSPGPATNRVTWLDSVTDAVGEGGGAAGDCATAGATTRKGSMVLSARFIEQYLCSLYRTSHAKAISAAKPFIFAVNAPGCVDGLYAIRAGTCAGSGHMPVIRLETTLPLSVKSNQSHLVQKLLSSSP